MKKSKSTVVVILLFALIFTGILFFKNKDDFMSTPTDFSDYVVPLSGAGTGYYRHCYEELNSQEKIVYSVILEQLYLQPERVEVPDLADGDLQKVFNAISYDNPDLFNIGLNCELYKEGNKHYFSVEYSLDYETYQLYLKEVNSVVDRIVQRASDYATDYEKEKFVHDYIVSNCTYVSPAQSTNSSSVYGCLVEGKASCEGYSRSFQLILSRLNIDNRLVTGEGRSEGAQYVPHMWNLVSIDDVWYHADVTWDDPEGETSILSYTYFNVTTRDILLKHRNIEQELPLCNDAYNNYFVKENKFFTDGSNQAFYDGINDVVSKTVQNDEDFFQIRFSSKSAMEDAEKALFDSGVIYDAFKNAGMVSAGETSVSVNYMCDDYMYTILVLF